ncbi:MAG: methionyl-tRNA formyltransferase [Halanaerobiaceae bacterium]
MNIIFMGTPDFSVSSLEKLYNSDGIEVMSVVTQPDRPRGRGQQMQPTSVKKKALELGIDVLQTNNVNTDSFLEVLKTQSPDVIVVVAFGQKLSKELLDIPEYGCVNLHASILPEYRGASPIHQAILDGRSKTGVTTMYIDEGWDTGDMIYKKEIPILDDDTVGTLHDKLASIGADLLIKTLLDIKKGTAPREKQDDEKATYTSKIGKKTGKIDWTQATRDVYNQVRGVNPWPGAYTYYQGDLLKIWKARILQNYNGNPEEPGKIVEADSENGFVIETGDGFIEINELQPAGRKRMSAKDYLHGYNIDTDEILR